jgi:hypothetical protein
MSTRTVAEPRPQRGSSTRRGPARLQRLRRSAVACAAGALAFLFVGTAPATAGGPYLYASGGSIGQRLTVCAQDLGVRPSRGGTPFNYLYAGQTFLVQGVDSEFGSEWVYGFAYGNVNAHGYVQNGWFCIG